MDRVPRVVGVLVAVPVTIHAVGGPRFGHELHPSPRARRGRAEVRAESRLDEVDRGEDRGAFGAELVFRARPLVDRDELRRDSFDGPGRFGAAPGRRPAECDCDKDRASNQG